MAPSTGDDQTQYQTDAEFVSKNTERQIVTAPVLIPNREDRGGDVVSKDNIEEVAHEFMADYQNVDLMHSFKNVGVPVESWITPTDLSYEMGGESKEVPEGSWMLTVKVTNEEVWQGVKSGQITGFSIYGAGREVPA